MSMLVVPLQTMQAKAVQRDWRVHGLPFLIAALVVVAVIAVCLSPVTEPALMTIAGP